MTLKFQSKYFIDFINIIPKKVIQIYFSTKYSLCINPLVSVLQDIYNYRFISLLYIIKLIQNKFYFCSLKVWNHKKNNRFTKVHPTNSSSTSFIYFSLRRVLVLKLTGTIVYYGNCQTIAFYLNNSQIFYLFWVY